MVGIILSIENGSAIQGNLDNIKYFYEQGVRLMGITWNQDNDLGCGVATKNDTGLTSLGIEYIKELNKLHIMIDISHASPKTISDVLDISTQPVIASHSCVMSICGHRRNLTDEQIINIAQKGGVIGITLYKPFLNKDGKVDSSDVFKHIDYIVNLVGKSHVGIGSDFQIYEPDEMPNNVKNLDDFKNIINEMKKNGYNNELIANVCGYNFIDVFCKVL